MTVPYTSVRTHSAVHVLSPAAVLDRTLGLLGLAAFYQPVAVSMRSVMKRSITYDDHDLLVTATEVPLDLTITAQYDYRVLGPWQTGDVMDSQPDGSRSSGSSRARCTHEGVRCAFPPPRSWRAPVLIRDEPRA